ncbi:resistance to lethality of mkk1p386 overexpression [Podospora bellae-mahoneyi]|uniref:Resistance to lethality of mkk1p386 overexpression n=1 Tax=Podospora bellae-mahoneyi TaxID=2093777 RepID=A0ABR0FXZ8_9PEZI|nr:resistance to lethality of mkk1p386 overexpression [Podospora bellae-mahoneyi]
MGRRKIEIKAIKDDRNRSVAAEIPSLTMQFWRNSTFLKRKGGLFKKAHELSVLCSVDVAVFIFGSNKKLYEYSSCDMRDLITRYTYHGGPNEHKGPSDFNGGADDEEEDDENGTPPQGDGMDAPMLHPHFQAQPQFPPHIRHHTPSASPPIPNGMFGPGPRGHTPQPPQMGSRPSSRNDIRRMGPMGGPQVGPQGPPPQAVNGYAFMPQPAIYNPHNAPNMPPNASHGLPPQYPYPGPPPHPQQMQQFAEERRRSSVPPNYPPQAQGPPAPRHSVSPPRPQAPQLPHQLPAQLPPRSMPSHMVPSPPQPQMHPMQSPPLPQQHLAPPPSHELPQIRPPPQEPQPPAPVETMAKPELVDRPRQPPLLDTAIKKAPPRKGGSIFTPIDENRSILSQHLAAFHPEVKSEPQGNRSLSLDMGKNGTTNSPPHLQRSNTQTQPQIKRNGSLSSIPETVFTPPSRSNSLRIGSISRPRLKVQIPDESDGGSATAESASPRNTTTTTDATSQPSRRPESVVLPPPSPSASSLLSAGATGPPNPFARPPPASHQNNSMNIDTPVSALPSRFMTNEFLPSPSSFYPEWNFRGSDSNTLPSPLNFATPVVSTGPSFLRDDPVPQKRKSPEISGNGHGPEQHVDIGGDAKRVKVDS